jgi:hypothetical protein
VAWLAVEVGDWCWCNGEGVERLWLVWGCSLMFAKDYHEYSFINI